MVKKISVVFCRTAYGTMAGRAQMLLRLLNGIDKERFDVTVVTQRKDEFYDRASGLDVTLVVVPFRGILDTYGGGLLDAGPLKRVTAGLRLLQYNLEFQRRIETPDVIWFDGTRSLVTLLPYVNFSNTISIWGIGLLQKSEGTMKYINSATLRSVDHVFIESETQARRLLTDEQYEKYEDKFTMFHKGIDVRKFDPSKYNQENRDDLHIGTAALINPRKGLEHFIDAAQQILNKRDDIHFTIAGEPAREEDAQYRQTLMDQLHNYDIVDNVEFAGWIEDMPRYLNTLDVFVLPSLNEGIPGAVREALAMEVPVVATDVGGTSEAVIDGTNGYLVEPENPDQIAEKVLKLLDHMSKREAFGKRGREHIVENFSMESYVAEYEQFLEVIANS